MNFKKAYYKLKRSLYHKAVKYNYSLKELSSMKIGGKCKIYVEVYTIEELLKTYDILFQLNIKYYVLGACSNVIIDDDGYDGAIIKLNGDFYNIYENGNKILVGGAVKLNKLCMTAYGSALSGMEEGIGIPGTIGGAIYMNANAYGFQVGEVCDSVMVFVDGKIKLLTNFECEFGYRSSIFQKMKNPIIIRAEFVLKNGEKEKIWELMKDTLEKRKIAQPLEYYSVGSVFKKTNGISAGVLIDKCGLKGYKIGNVFVSEKHANFFVTTGGAKSKDFIELVRFVKQKVKEVHNVDIYPEVVYLGEKNDIW